MLLQTLDHFGLTNHRPFSFFHNGSMLNICSAVVDIMDFRLTQRYSFGKDHSRPFSDKFALKWFSGLRKFKLICFPSFLPHIHIWSRQRRFLKFQPTRENNQSQLVADDPSFYQIWFQLGEWFVRNRLNEILQVKGRR